MFCGVFIGLVGSLFGAIGCLPRDWWSCLYDGQEHNENYDPHGAINVTPRLMPH
jgi:hypothetical protein